MTDFPMLSCFFKKWLNVILPVNFTGKLNLIAGLKVKGGGGKEQILLLILTRGSVNMLIFLFE